MAVRRESYRTRKEYRWAKKLEKRQIRREAGPLLFPLLVVAVVVAALMTHSLLGFFALVMVAALVIGTVGGIVAGLKR